MVNILNIIVNKKTLFIYFTLILFGTLIEILIHHYDPTRVLYKRLKAENEFVYEKIDPKLLNIDPYSLVSVRTVADLQQTQARLIEVFWGAAGFPAEVQPTAVEHDVTVEAFGNLPNLARIDRLVVDMGNDVRSRPLYFRPAETDNGDLVIYHHGFAGNIEDVSHIIGAFLERGYSVLAIDLLGYGGAKSKYRASKSEQFNLHYDLDKIPTPLRYHLEPVVVGLNHALRDSDYGSVSMVGFSAGSFVTTAVAAVDPRILRSYPVAGVYPIYLRTGPEIQIGMPSTYPPMIEVANYLDLFVLGAAGAGRRQLQIFNRYDRCCYNNTKGKLYEPAVAETVGVIGEGGEFMVLIDETHADHKISQFAVDAILADLERPSPAPR